MVEFIRQNPFTSGFNAEQGRLDARNTAGQGTALRQLQLDELRRTRDSNIGIDKAIRDFIREGQGRPGAQSQAPADPNAALAPATVPAGPGQAPTGQGAPAGGQGPGTAPSAPRTSLGSFGGLEQSLADVPGGGAAALGLRQSETQRQADRISKELDLFFEAVKTGVDPTQIKFIGARVGITAGLDAVLSDATKRQQLAQAAQWKEFYGNDILSFGKFLADAFQNEGPGGPDYRGAFARNPPTNQAQASNQSQDRVLARTEWLIQNLGLDQAEAFRLAQDNPLNARTRLWTTIYKGAIDDLQSTDEAAVTADRLTDDFIKKFGSLGAEAAEPTDRQIAIDPPRDDNGLVDPTQLVPGQSYNTVKGPAVWDGRLFTPVNPNPTQ